jgi:transposase
VTISQDTAPTKKIQLPDKWPATVKSAVLQVISLAQYAAAYTRGWAANSPNARLRLKAEKDRSDAELEQTREDVRIKDARMGSLDPYRRPNYPPPERMAILALKTARGWSLEQTAKRFLVSPATIASWMKRLDEQGPHALVQLPGGPVNKFPQFVRLCVQRLKTLAPTMGKAKIAQTLARAGLHLGTTTVGRILKGGQKATDPAPAPSNDPPSDANLSPDGTSETINVDIVRHLHAAGDVALREVVEFPVARSAGAFDLALVIGHVLAELVVGRGGDAAQRVDRGRDIAVPFRILDRPDSRGCGKTWEHRRRREIYFNAKMPALVLTLGALRSQGDTR